MCTGIRLIAKNGTAVYARTLEFGKDIESNIVVIPRNYSCIGIASSGNAQGLSWQSKYAVVGANALNLVELVDGVNERGLAGGLFYFPDYAQYQEVANDQVAQSIAPWQLMTWILTNFCTVAQVKQALPTIKVSNAIFGPWGVVLPVHAIVHEPSGQSLVIEYVQGQLTMYDNPLGVFTNAPTFDWHMTNLKNYLNLSNLNVAQKKLSGITLMPFGQGSGLLGLPGDFTPPARFVRAVVFSHTAQKINNEEEIRESAFHILNLFDISLGAVCQQQDKQVHCEYTQWTSAADLQRKRYYFHTYDNRQVRMVDLMDMDLTAEKPIIVQMARAEHILNSTPKK